MPLSTSDLLASRSLLKRRFTVGIAVEAMNNYGRLILRGIHRYSNARREWLLHEELRPSGADFKMWPKVDGSIFAGLEPPAARMLANRSRFIVSCSSAFDPKKMPIVSADNEAIGRMAAEHLLDRGLKHFAFYENVDRTGLQRMQGFRKAVEERSYTCSVWSGKPNMTDRSIHRHWPAVLAWLAGLPKPIGIMARDDHSGSDLSAACLDGGMIVPDQVAIVAVNNDDIICEAAWPPLSSVEVDFARVGYVAAQQLDVLLHGGKIPVTRRHLLVAPLGVCPRLSSDVQSVDDSTLATAIAFIREHARSGCSVGDVLKIVPVSRSWLERQFKEKLGRTPHDEIARVRMEHARRLLIETAEPIGRIAVRCGFSAVQNFNRAFVQREGISPAAFRRSHSLT